MTFLIIDTGICMKIVSPMHGVVRDFISDNKKALRNYSNQNEKGDAIYCSMIALFEMMTLITTYFEADGWTVKFVVDRKQNQD